jgi:putative methyltransferase (TIGR04325 family)
MEWSGLAIALVKPLVPASVLQRRAGSRFFREQGWKNLHLGKYASFRDAAEFAREHGAPTGYRIDHDQWAHVQSTIKAHDYPVLYWLGRLLERNAVLCDFGGSVGVCYYAYRDRLQFPDDVSWVVCELPEPAMLGAELAKKRQASGLSFTTDRSSMDGCDILLAAGVLPFVESRLVDLLAGLKRPPRHILINRLPLCTETSGYITLQNTGQSFTPMRIDNYADFVGGMDRVGYDLADAWKCFESSLYIPQHPECTLRHFHGFCFRHRETAVAAPFVNADTEQSRPASGHGYTTVALSSDLSGIQPL